MFTLGGFKILWSYLAAKLASVYQGQVGRLSDRRMLELRRFASIAGQLVPMENADHSIQIPSICLSSGKMRQLVDACCHLIVALELSSTQKIFDDARRSCSSESRARRNISWALLTHELNNLLPSSAILTCLLLHVEGNRRFRSMVTSISLLAS